jgi:hypothetical protein
VLNKNKSYAASRQVEKGDGFFHALLIRFISIVSGMRLPDAARIVMYHQDFYGKPMSAWTQAAKYLRFQPLNTH